MITGLPRSRTAWFSAWCSAMGAPSIHEMLAKVDDVDAYSVLLSKYVDCCTYGALLAERYDRVVIIHRDIEEVLGSLEEALPPHEAAKVPSLRADYVGFAQRLREMRGLHVEYDDIDARLRNIAEYLEIPFDWRLSDELKALHIEADLSRFDQHAMRLLSNLGL